MLYLNQANNLAESIESDRQKAITKVIDVLNGVIKRYQGPSLQCSSPSHDNHGRRACDGTILGTLLKSAAEKGLYPLPKPPYHGLICYEVARDIASLNISSLCRHVPRYIPDSQQCHGVREALSLEAELLFSNCPGSSLSLFNDH